MVLWGADQLTRIEPDFALAPFAECQRRKCFVGRWCDQTPSGASPPLLIVCADALDLETQAWMEPLLERQAPEVLIRALVPRDVLTEFFARHESSLTAMDNLDAAEFVDDADEIEPVLELSIGSIEATQNPTVRLVDSTLYDALRCGASDVHLELHQQGLHVKYRLDGVLQAVARIESLATAHQVISRIKVLSDLDISERRVPQDGRFRVVHDSSMVVIHETVRKREREDELLFVGAQYRRAILSYYNSVPPGGGRSLPPTLEALVVDARFPMPVAHLRRLYPDPMTGKLDWEVERAAGGIVGLRSRSLERPLKTKGFPAGLEYLEGRKHYGEWLFSIPP